MKLALAVVLSLFFMPVLAVDEALHDHLSLDDNPHMHAEGEHILIGVMDLELPLSDLVQTIISEAYSGIGRVAHFLKSPPRRSLMLTNSGRLDGELFRMPYVEKKFPNLVRVAHPLATVKIYPYSLNDGLEIASCDHLAGHTIGVVRGIVALERCAKASTDVIYFADAETTLKALLIGRVEIVLAEEFLGKTVMQFIAPESVKKAAVEPLMEFQIFHYLNADAAKELASPLTEMLQTMESSGYINEIKQAWEQQIKQKLEWRSKLQTIR